MKHQPVQVADICNLDLADMCTYVAHAYEQDKQAVSGAVFAHVAQRLIAAEVQPGGPYKDANGTPTQRVNSAVRRLFLLMGKPLPQVDAFLAVGAKKQEQLRTSTPSFSAPYRRARTTLQKLQAPLQSQALSFLERVAAADTTKEIAYIATFTAQALGVTIPASTLNRLGEANIYTWISYMLYDHIIDGELPPATVPVANVAMRLALAGYQAASPNAATTTRIANYFTAMDHANAWELAQCRFTVNNHTIHIAELPDFGDLSILADRSGGHILGPLIVAARAPLGSRKYQQFTQGLRQYLIARQLSDDLHDWQQDLAAGHISPVVAQLLAHSSVAPGAYDVRELTQRLQQDFLHHTMVAVSNQITTHSQNAAALLQKAGCHKTGKLARLVDRLTHLAAASRAEQSRFLEFSKAYTSTQHGAQKALESRA